MKTRVVAGLLTGLFLGVAGAQQERGNWRPRSETARSVTGDIAITERKVIINFSGFTIAQIRDLTETEASAAFPEAAAGRGSLYRLSIPGEQRFLHKNSLCGSDETQWMVTYAAKKSLQVAFFSGSKMPDLTAEGMVNATNLCGTYSYAR